MKKKKPSTLEAALETFVPDPEAFTDTDVDEILAGAGASRDELHRKVAESARSLGARLRKNNVPAPVVLRDVIDALGSSDSLPRDLGLAKAQASKRVADLERQSSVDPNYRLQEAARKGPGALSDKDQRLLDAEKEDFMRELDEENDKTK
jgi:hypothetical protein